MTDYKQLCAELYGIFEKYDDESNLAGIYWDMESDGNDLLDRARAALAEPEPEEPTRRQLMMLADDMEMASVSEAVEYALIVLARWGK